MESFLSGVEELGAAPARQPARSSPAPARSFVNCRRFKISLLSLVFGNDPVQNIGVIKDNICGSMIDGHDHHHGGLPSGVVILRQVVAVMDEPLSAVQCLLPDKPSLDVSGVRRSTLRNSRIHFGRGRDGCAGRNRRNRTDWHRGCRPGAGR